MTDLAEILECAHVGPGDCLVLRVGAETTFDQVMAVREAIAKTVLNPEQVVIVGGFEEMVVVDAADPLFGQIMLGGDEC